MQINEGLDPHGELHIAFAESSDDTGEQVRGESCGFDPSETGRQYVSEGNSPHKTKLLDNFPILFGLEFPGPPVPSSQLNSYIYRHLNTRLSIRLTSRCSDHVLRCRLELPPGSIKNMTI